MRRSGRRYCSGWSCRGRGAQAGQATADRPHQQGRGGPEGVIAPAGPVGAVDRGVGCGAQARQANPPGSIERFLRAELEVKFILFRSRTIFVERQVDFESLGNLDAKENIVIIKGS